MEKRQLQMSITEGLAELQLKSDKIFYNQVQEFNRDLSIAVLNVFIADFKKEKLENLREKEIKDVEDQTKNIDEVPITVLEALAASGLRSIRYAKEVQGINKIIANDLSLKAVESIKENVECNGVSHIVETSHDEATMVMYKHKNYNKRITALDLDPYGCPSIFLDSAVQCVEDGGILLITATDMAVLAGNSPETCYVKYGSVSLKVKCCHEMALRILLQCVEQHANRYCRYIEPLLSVSADFYIRVFVRIRTGAIHCKKTTSKVSMVYQCTGCENMVLQPLGGFKPNPTEKNPNRMKTFLPTVPPVGEHCVHCNQTHHLGGPIWTAPIHNVDFVKRVLAFVQQGNNSLHTAKRLNGVLSMIIEELQDVPLYYVLDKVFGKVHLQTMPMLTMRSAILNAGYRVSLSHASKMSLKTDAPAALLWDIVRCWQETHPVSKTNFTKDPVCKFIIEQPMTYTVNLTERADANPDSRKLGSLRFQTNPAPHWGPGSRSQVNVGDAKPKSVRNQNKNVNKKKALPKREHSPEEGINKRTAVEAQIIE